MIDIKTILTAVFSASVLFLASCGRVEVPSGDVSDGGRPPHIWPDYTAITVPPNIAPLNFGIEENGGEFIVRMKADGGTLVEKGPSVRWDLDDWHELLEKNRGKEIMLEVYVKGDDGKWTLYSSPLKVAREEIDPYFSYRLIEPSFVQYNCLSLNQRNLTNFDTEVIFNNSYTADESEMSCINCHVPRNQYRDGKTQFHVRQSHGGTLIMDGDSIKRVDLSTDSTNAAGVYQAWHPTLDLIAYSTNGTRQYFFTKDLQKVEVLDEWSDIILYDVEREKVVYVANDSALLETFPAWSPDGKKLYYSVARRPGGPGKDGLSEKYAEVRYDIVSRDFDLASRGFSAHSDTVVAASAAGKSASLPRVSPDGRFLMTCISDFGTFHIWHRSSDLWLTDLKDGKSRCLSNANSENADSYHSWSSNSRWVIFSSRRDDGSYTRPYITYVDADGNDSKAFVVPQEDPGYYRMLMKSYNVPEFMVAPVKYSRSDVLEALGRDPVRVAYGK